MKNINTLLLVISSIIVSFAVVMGFVLDAYCVKIVPHNDLILYIISKVLFGLLFITIAALCIIKQKSRNYYIQYVAVLIAQVIPLSLRYLSLLEKGFVISITIFFVTLIILFGVILGIAFVDKKEAAVSKRLQGEVTIIEDNNEQK